LLERITLNDITELTEDESDADSDSSESDTTTDADEMDLSATDDEEPEVVEVVAVKPVGKKRPIAPRAKKSAAKAKAEDSESAFDNTEGESVSILHNAAILTH
jgi:hypothetical protein